MGHVPFVVVPPPWTSDALSLGPDHTRHLRTVLRLVDGAPVEYTDGSGLVGSGTLDGASIVRGPETRRGRPRELTIAVAVPSHRDRQRYLVEKLAELGVSRILWIPTRFGSGRPPKQERAEAWALSALEQSRGAWRTVVEAVDELPPRRPGLVATDIGGRSEPPPTTDTIMVGPEGGWAPGELEDEVPRWSLGSRVLRVETAAVVAAARLLADEKGGVVPAHTK